MEAVHEYNVIQGWRGRFGRNVKIGATMWGYGFFLNLLTNRTPK